MPSSDVENQQQDPHADDGVTWWCKMLAKIAGVIAAIICFVCAISVFITLSLKCVFAGVIMLIISFILLLFEAPICCAYFKGTQKVNDWITRRRYWHKGLVYILISIVPVIICPEISTILGCVVPFATGVIYGLMSLGKKADKSEMLSKAGGNDFQQFDNTEE